MGGIKSAFKWIAIAIGGFVAIVFICLIGLGVGVESGVFPQTLVQTGEELPKRQDKALRKEGILKPDEVVKFYYSAAVIDITDNGTIMTDKRILGYWTENDVLEVYAYPLDTIDRLVMNNEGDFLTDAEYAVAQRGDDENSLLLFLSIEEDRHLEMISALETQIENNNSQFIETQSE